jgi:formate dehydrogenase subunit gamma
VEVFRWERSPWGQQTLAGLSWDMLYAAALAGVLFVLVDALYRWKWPIKVTREEDLARLMETEGNAGSDSERVVRHPLASRLFHWAMAASMFALLITGFLPILGIQFSWVTAHWIAGLVLAATIIFHLVHATFWLSLRSMWITRKDIRDSYFSVRRLVGKKAPEPGKPGKYPLENKLFHHATAVATFAVIGTGLVMMVRVDTPFWTRNPYLFLDQTWGYIYLVHGISSVAFVAMIIAHIYFAVRPEKWGLTRSMIKGWITRKQYLEDHDPALWQVKSTVPKVAPKRTDATSLGTDKQA